MKNSPQIKICGLTNVDEALGCADLGANAIGLVFYPRSPRNVTEDQAKEISTALPIDVKTVGVFVDETFSNIMRKAEHCRLDAVQLHGQESSGLVSKLRDENLIVIKGLFMKRSPFLEDAAKYDASAFLVECGKGTLPGGNAMSWNWEEAKDFGEKYPFILAGGLSPDNVSRAIRESMPDAVDVSSGVESAPGRKDIHEAEAFVNAVLECDLSKKIRKIF
ncbi:phosphoribosylanthranilate isomerase [Desulfococcaceae bacterium HSG8]|nr:phosphoribosylanthranilate isomerase [Desulfococcaceae bacterium HSG8]